MPLLWNRICINPRSIHILRIWRRTYKSIKYIILSYLRRRLYHILRCNWLWRRCSWYSIRDISFTTSKHCFFRWDCPSFSKLCKNISTGRASWKSKSPWYMRSGLPKSPRIPYQRFCYSWTSWWRGTNKSQASCAMYQKLYYRRTYYYSCRAFFMDWQWRSPLHPQTRRPRCFWYEILHQSHCILYRNDTRHRRRSIYNSEEVGSLLKSIFNSKYWSWSIVFSIDRLLSWPAPLTYETQAYFFPQCSVCPSVLLTLFRSVLDRNIPSPLHHLLLVYRTKKSNRLLFRFTSSIL